MLTEIKLPAMGATMEEGIISVWHVAVGDVVKEGKILFEFESDKSTFEFESPCNGTVLVLLAEEGDTVPVLNTVALVGDPDEEIPKQWL
jgi:pyruvate/2-oxoglutarate dehydrogenase complex dihydrolipoamide acyltransferase (E2) component